MEKKRDAEQKKRGCSEPEYREMKKGRCSEPEYREVEKGKSAG